MRFPIVPLFAVLAALGFCANSQAQEDSDRETVIHRNVRLTEIAATPDIPASLASQYQKFLPMFRDVLKENTKDQADEKSLILNVAAGVKEVGAAKTKRAQARVTAFCRNSRKEYIGNFLLHSYASNAPVNREETEQFLRKQILEPMECYVPTARVAAPVKAKQESVPVVAEVKPAVPDKYAPTPAPTPTPAPKPTPAPTPTPAPRTVERSPIAQEQSTSEVEIHKNVYLFDTAAAPEIPADLASQYRSFLAVFKENLRESTRDQTDENRLIMRVAAGIREVGPEKNKRAHVRVTSLIGNTNKEYISDFSLYSYVAARPVNKEEIAQFLRMQILEPLECYAPTASVAAPVRPEPKPEPVPVPAEQKPAAPQPEARAVESRMAEQSPMPQERSDRESEIRKNVRLIELAAAPDIPAEIAAHYHAFLPMFREVLKANTRDQADKDHLIIRVAAGIKEVGSAKIKRAQARVTSFCRNSKREYIGNFILYSYTTNGPVNKEETEQFLRKQILEPMECYVPAESVLASPKPAR
jgi:outer membrane biosynthesis protein TonB